MQPPNQPPLRATAAGSAPRPGAGGGHGGDSPAAASSPRGQAHGGLVPRGPVHGESVQRPPARREPAHRQPTHRPPAHRGLASLGPTSPGPTSPGPGTARAAAGSPLLRDAAASLLLFLLLWEWLRPLPQLSDVSELYMIKPFLVVFAICMTLDWLRIPYALGWMLKALVMIATMGYLFYPESFPFGSWLVEYAQLLYEDIWNTASGQLHLISPETRTLLFLTGWTLLISVTQALMLQRQHSLWFVIMTIVYLLVLQLVFGADTVSGIVRTAGCGLLLAALLNLSRIEQVYGVRFAGRGWPLSWLLLGLLAAAVVAGLGSWNPLSKPAALMKPLDWTAFSAKIEGLYGDPGGPSPLLPGPAKTGYGQDDTVLGGPVSADNSVVFTAKTSELTYWRGESKSFYDGKGWTQTEPDWRPLDREDGAAGAMAGGEPIVQEVLWNAASRNKQLFYGGRLSDVQALLTEKGKPLSPGILLVERESGKVTLPEIADPLSYYKLESYKPAVDAAALNAASADYPAEVAEPYLQLPAKLPRAVRQLAEQITEGKSTPYAKAAAIEHYLQATFPYSLEEPTRPGKGEDFVSHFLFVDQAGYCNHFSTAMVVMLRSVGVPARWVKGFAPGAAGGEDAANMREVTVRAKDAHSWAEVYFPGYGWVPFEPTPGFAGQRPASAANEPAAVSVFAGQPQAAAGLAQTGGTRAAVGQLLKGWQETAAASWSKQTALLAGALLLLALACAGAAAAAASYRRKRSAAATALFTPLRAGVKRDWHPAVRQMERVWLKVFRRFGVKPEHQTVREYVQSLPPLPPGQQQALLEFAAKYEAIRYAAQEYPVCSKREIAALWKAIRSH